MVLGGPQGNNNGRHHVTAEVAPALGKKIQATEVNSDSPVRKLNEDQANAWAGRFLNSAIKGCSLPP
jgi:hypothetical protein